MVVSFLVIWKRDGWLVLLLRLVLLLSCFSVAPRLRVSFGGEARGVTLPDVRPALRLGGSAVVGGAAYGVCLGGLLANDHRLHVRDAWGTDGTHQRLVLILSRRLLLVSRCDSILVRDLHLVQSHLLALGLDFLQMVLELVLVLLDQGHVRQRLPLQCSQPFLLVAALNAVGMLLLSSLAKLMLPKSSCSASGRLHDATASPDGHAILVEHVLPQPRVAPLHHPFERRVPFIRRRPPGLVAVVLQILGMAIEFLHELCLGLGYLDQPARVLGLAVLVVLQS